MSKKKEKKKVCFFVPWKLSQYLNLLFILGSCPLENQSFLCHQMAGNHQTSL